MVIDTWPEPLTIPLCPDCDEEARYYKDDRYICAPCVSIWTIPGITKRITAPGWSDMFWIVQCVYCLIRYWGSYNGPLEYCLNCEKDQPDAKGRR